MLTSRFVAGAVAAALAALVAVSPAGTALGAEDEEDLIARGKLLFEETAGDVGCAACHGMEALGDPEIGAPFIRGAGRAQLDASLDGGVPDMEFLTVNRQERTALVSYLEYLAHSEDVVLDPEASAGRVIFEETAGGIGCQACHGVDAAGDVAPDIRGMDAGAILEQLRVNEEMSFISLSSKEIDQVAAYLKYLHALEDH